MTVWTPDRVATLRRLAARGDKPTAETIGHLMGCGRNAVIGACHRFGVKLQRRRKDNWSGGGRPRKERAAPYLARNGEAVHRPFWPKPPAALLKPRSLRKRKRSAEAPAAGSVTLIELGADHCRFPYGEEAPFLFCGEQKERGSSYCAAHRAICWGPSQ